MNQMTKDECKEIGVVNMSMSKCQEHVAQLSQRDRAARCVSFGQKWKTGTGKQYSADIIGPSSTTVT